MPTIIYGDEFGDPSDKFDLKENGSYEPSRVFGYGMSVPFNDKEFAEIRVKLGELKELIDKYGGNIPDEIKAKKLSDKLKRWLSGLIGKKARSHAFIVDKDGKLPDGWKEYNGSQRMIALMLYSLEQILPTVDDTYILVILDDHTAYHLSWVVPYLNLKTEEYRQYYGKVVRIAFSESAKRRFTNQLQAVDMVAHASLLDEERNISEFSRMAKIDVHVLDESDSIVQAGMLDYVQRSENRRKRIDGLNEGYYAIVEVSQ